MNIEHQYLDYLQYTLDSGVERMDRTGTGTITCPHPIMMQHSMELGFPLLTTKEVAFKSVRVELEAFIKGITDKQWLKARGCTIWNEWGQPSVVDAYMEEHGETDRKKAQLEVNELGKIYGYAWRNFNDGCVEDSSVVNDGSQDQLKTIIDTLKTNPDSRRLVCSAWNPLETDLALPPCHWGFMIQHINGTLNLTWIQRSCDAMAGWPFNVSSYALLLHLICLETGMKEGILTGVFNDFHIYSNHVDQCKEQLSRDRNKYNFPKIKTEGFASIYDWDYTMTKSVGYKDNHYGKIKLPIAV